MNNTGSDTPPPFPTKPEPSPLNTRTQYLASLDGVMARGTIQVHTLVMALTPPGQPPQVNTEVSTHLTLFEEDPDRGKHQCVNVFTLDNVVALRDLCNEVIDQTKKSFQEAFAASLAQGKKEADVMEGDDPDIGPDLPDTDGTTLDA